jgi:4-alpha-glucanotransferase
MDELLQLAGVYGIQTSYYSVAGQLQNASEEALLRVLQALGAPIQNKGEAPGALRQRAQYLASRTLEPVTVVWQGGPAELRLLVREGGPARLRCEVCLESGEQRVWESSVEDLPVIEVKEIDGSRYVYRRLVIRGPVPLGHHQVRLDLASERAECLLLVAPVRSYDTDKPQFKTWGVFLPLYALYSKSSWGAGDLSDLEALIDWTNAEGGGLVATLPLLAAFLDEPFEPGPYSPASRLFWNEFYVNLNRIPELHACPDARSLLQAADVLAEIDQLRRMPLVDYHKQMALKRRILAQLASHFFAQGSEVRRQAFREFLATHGQAEDYAAFRATTEKNRRPWPAWPARQRDGVLEAGDYDDSVKNYHLYVQWVADEQLQFLAARAKKAGLGFYLDLPLGVNPDSYDVWRERQAFASGIAAGAPPDPFFAQGQNWGFPPLHPERIRERGYRYIAAYLRHHLNLAGVLRIDHMMGFHRLFWVPHGLEAREGVYVRYAAEELYALFALESHRSRSILVGEDLGTVPPEVRPAMENHGIHRMYVMQFEVQPQNQEVLTPVYPGCVASLNTHDIAPFAAFWHGLDIKDRLELGTLDPGVAQGELNHRRWLWEALKGALRQKGLIQNEQDPQQVLEGCLKHMCQGSAMVVLLNLEDVWQETNPQNVPGTWRERPNWRRRARHSLEEMKELPALMQILRLLGESTRPGLPNEPAPAR